MHLVKFERLKTVMTTLKVMLVDCLVQAKLTSVIVLSRNHWFSGSGTLECSGQSTAGDSQQ